MTVFRNKPAFNGLIFCPPDAVHLKHPGSTYSAPTYIKKAPTDSIGHSSGRVLRMTGDLTGKHHRESKRSTSEINYAGSGYGTLRQSQSGTLRSKNILYLDHDIIFGWVFPRNTSIYYYSFHISLSNAFWGLPF